MANDTQDARSLLAKMEAEENAAVAKVAQIKEDNDKKRKELLGKLRDADLEDVKAKCKLHGFTATELRGFLKTKGGGRKSAATKSVGRKGTRGRKGKKAAA